MHSMISIGIVMFRGKHENPLKLGVTIECTDALYDVLVENLKDLPHNLNLASHKMWSCSREIIVHKSIELASIGER